MTVKELIDQLTMYPMDSKVEIRIPTKHGDDYKEIDQYNITTIQSSEWAGGNYIYPTQVVVIG